MVATLSPWLEPPRSNRERVLQQLIRGQECANQLLNLFHKLPCEENGPLSGEELVQNILNSFNDTLSALSSQDQTTCNDNSPRSEGCSESRKRLPSKAKRGCYKRKKGAETWTIVSATMEDGHAWRKYGQKKIMNSKHPRSYFRCTRKYGQGCRAMKQVQRMEDDPPMYESTYIGTHTCMDSFRAPQMIPDSECWESVMGMGSQIPIKQHQPLNPCLEREAKEVTRAASDGTGLDSMVWKEIMGGDGFESSSEPVSMGFWEMGF